MKRAFRLSCVVTAAVPSAVPVSSASVAAEADGLALSDGGAVVWVAAIWSGIWAVSSRPLFATVKRFVLSS